MILLPFVNNQYLLLLWLTCWSLLISWSAILCSITGSQCGRSLVLLRQGQKKAFLLEMGIYFLFSFSSSFNVGPLVWLKKLGNKW